MKQILIALMLAMAFCLSATAQKATVFDQDSSSSYIPEYTDVADSSITVVSEEADSYDSYTFPLNESDFSALKDIGNIAHAGIAVAIVALVLIFGFPIFIIFIAFYFRYKSRRDQYKLVEKALAAGQPIPEGIFKESLNRDTRTKGIKNTCLGIGLFILLWAFTDSFALGSIGLLIMFTGIGQWLTARNQPPVDKQ